MEKLTEALGAVISEIQAMPDSFGLGCLEPGSSEPEPTDRKEFALLLSGISTCRRAPGIPVHMGYETLYHCQDDKSAGELKEHLFRLYGIYDRESLEEACMKRFTSGKEYEQFMTFWCGAPLFDLDELEEEGRRAFEERFELAAVFYPYLKERGFYAWDINERIGLGRKTCACGLITDEEFYEIFDYQIAKAQVFYHSFKEYAISCVCGALYFVPENREEDMLSFLDINANLVRHLLGEGGAWRRKAWYVPDEREWVQLLPHNGGCIVSKQIEEGRPIGYMYRDKDVSEKWPDTGWRFFAGDETDAYVNDPKNASIWSLNHVCNLDPTILGYVEAKGGSAFGRNSLGEWARECL